MFGEKKVKLNKKILIIAPHFPPLRTSAAHQMRDLVDAFSKKKINTYVITPNFNQDKLVIEKKTKYSYVIKVKTPKFIDINFFKRFFVEFVNPYILIFLIRNNKITLNSYDGIIYYSPSIFLSPLLKFFKKRNSCKIYLILRDIFPKWAFDLKVIDNVFIYKFLCFFEKKLYKLSDTIGVQTPSNLNYFRKLRLNSHIHVLPNWQTNLFSKKIMTFNKSEIKNIVYTGNLGIAQDIQILIDFAKHSMHNQNLRFIFIGRGLFSDQIIKYSKIFHNIKYYDEMELKDLQKILDFAHVGMFSLNKNHSLDNIPGKFLTYLNNQLPVIGFVNKGNDILKFSINYKFGYVTSSRDLDKMYSNLMNILDNVNYFSYKEDAKRLFNDHFDVDTTVDTICESL